MFNLNTLAALCLYILSLIFNKSVNFKYKSERTKERSKVTLYSEALDFDNIDNPPLFYYFNHVQFCEA